jgi:hypothetical protein
MRPISSSLLVAFFLAAANFYPYNILADQGSGGQEKDGKRKCMHEKLGKPGGGRHHSPEEVEAAAKACGVDIPKLTQEQKDCLHKEMEKHEKGVHPSREEKHKVFEKCGIKPPQHHGHHGGKEGERPGPEGEKENKPMAP